MINRVFSIRSDHSALPFRTVQISYHSLSYRGFIPVGDGLSLVVSTFDTNGQIVVVLSIFRIRICPQAVIISGGNLKFRAYVIPIDLSESWFLKCDPTGSRMAAVGENAT